MNKERPVPGKVIDLSMFRKAGIPAIPRPYAYSMINAENVVDYGIEDVSPDDSLRLMRASLALCLWLLDIHEGK